MSLAEVPVGVVVLMLLALPLLPVCSTVRYRVVRVEPVMMGRPSPWVGE